MKQKTVETILSNKILRVVAPKFFSGINQVKGVSPEITIAAGIVTGVVAAVMLAKAYKKAEEEVEPIREEINLVNDALASMEHLLASPKENQTPDDILEIEDSFVATKKEVIKLYGSLAGSYIRLYVPPLAAGSLSVLLLLKSHNMMTNRNNAMFAVAQVATQSFMAYRKRVVAELGEDFDQRIFMGGMEREIINTRVDADGKKHKTKRTITVLGEDPSPLMYARVFERGTSTSFTGNPVMDRHYIKTWQAHLQNMLIIHGIVTLNDAYKSLGFEQSEAGQSVGWSKNGPDGFIDFGLDRPVNDFAVDKYYLDFNVEGVVSHLFKG